MKMLTLHTTCIYYSW